MVSSAPPLTAWPRSCSSISRSAPSSSVMSGCQSASALHVLRVGLDVLAAARLHRNAEVHERGGHLVLGGERVGRAERHLGAAGGERLHQVGRLGGHVQAGGHLHAVERLLGPEALADRAEDRHLALRPLDPRQPLRGQRRIGYVCRQPARHQRGAGGVSPRVLVPVVLGLVRALDRHADVGGLLGRELRELRAERVEVQRGRPSRPGASAARRPSSRTRRSS